MTFETKAQETLWKRECVDSERRGGKGDCCDIVSPRNDKEPSPMKPQNTAP